MSYSLEDLIADLRSIELKNTGHPNFKRGNPERREFAAQFIGAETQDMIAVGNDGLIHVPLIDPDKDPSLELSEDEKGHPNSDPSNLERKGFVEKIIGTKTPGVISVGEDDRIQVTLMDPDKDPSKKPNEYEKQLDLDLGLFTAKSAKEVSTLIAKGANPKRVFRNDHSRSCDHIAALDIQAIFGNPEAIRALVKAGAVYEDRRLNGTGYPFERALKRGKLDAAEALLDTEIAAHKVGHTVITALILFGLRVDKQKTTNMLDVVLNNTTTDKLNRNGSNVDDHGLIGSNFIDGNPLRAAVHMGDCEVIEKLLLAGADPNTSNALSMLTHTRNRSAIEPIAKLLIQYGADINLCPRKSNIPPIIAAAMNGDAALVNVFKDLGAAHGPEIVNANTSDRYPLDKPLWALDTQAIHVLRGLGAKSSDEMAGGVKSFTAPFNLRHTILRSASAQFEERQPGNITGNFRAKEPRFWNAQPQMQFDDQNRQPHDILLDVYQRTQDVLKAMGKDGNLRISMDDIVDAIDKRAPHLRQKTAEAAKLANMQLKQSPELG